jgi:hypothetical protein
MKWGVRRTPEQLGYSSNKDVRKFAESYADAHRELATYRMLTSERSRGNPRVTNEMIRLTNTRAYYGFKHVNKQIAQLKKKYTVDIEPGYESDGRQYTTFTLKDKLSNTYMHEIYTGVKDVGGYLYPENYG